MFGNVYHFIGAWLEDTSISSTTLSSQHWLVLAMFKILVETRRASNWGLCQLKVFMAGQNLLQRCSTAEKWSLICTRGTTSYITQYRYCSRPLIYLCQEIHIPKRLYYFTSQSFTVSKIFLVKITCRCGMDNGVIYVSTVSPFHNIYSTSCSGGIAYIVLWFWDVLCDATTVLLQPWTFMWVVKRFCVFG